VLAQEQARALVRRFASEARLCERESSWPSFHDAQRRRTARRSSSPRKIQKCTRDQILGVSVRPDRKARQGACLPGVCAERKKFHLIPQRCFSCLVRGGIKSTDAAATSWGDRCARPDRVIFGRILSPPFSGISVPLARKFSWLALESRHLFFVRYDPCRFRTECERWSAGGVAVASIETR